MDQKSLNNTNDKIVNIDNIVVATNVIKSLRSSSNSARCYKQNASRYDYIINDLEQFNKIVIYKTEENDSIEHLQKQMNDKIALYQPLLSYCNKNIDNQVLPTDNHNNKEGDSGNEESDLSDIDDIIKRKNDTNKHPPPKNNNNSSSNNYKHELGLDNTNTSDDDRDMSELFYDFVAPVHHSNTHAVRKQIERSGAGGIRGIQHQSALHIENNNHHNIDSNNSSFSSNASTLRYNCNNNNMIMRNLKPGQAIRIQPSLKK